ncbi:uncharacterized protein LOC127869235 [Dreissena polymorpha]|uniref:uncharacterized protein LOC127869235 n=1 Tax=Dreissena polymorpha TaxID=45954 RepID=UPI002263D1AF|nr:uncharacterized protein LOC127869235 [Dreissena polymorpha]
MVSQYCIDSSSCKSFQSMTLANRRTFVRKYKLCFNCLKGNRLSNNCRKPKECSVPDCSQKHHTLLHSWIKSDFDYTVTQPSVNCAPTSGCFVKTCLEIISVTVIGSEGQSYQTYALLDDGADKTLCDERLLQTLNVSSRPMTFQISTINATGSTTIGREVDLRVRNVMGICEVCLKNVWSVKRLPISKNSAASAKDISRFHYVADLNIPSVGAGDVMLLIGTDAPEAHIPLDVQTGKQNQPYAIRSRLGWVVRGPVQSTSDTYIGNDVNVNFSQSRDVLLQQLERMWTTDFNDVINCEKELFSVEDKRTLQIMKSTLSKENGHYKM